MKKSFILAAIAVLLGMASAYAQQIAVVSEGGETSVYQTFQAAIEGANPGSVIYLPGGGFTLSDDVKIIKKLTIIGVGYKSDNDNVDGTTTVNGNLWFNEGSSGSAVMGCYITGSIHIGENDASVNNVMVRCCNFKSVKVLNNTCLSTFINQNYIREMSNFSGANGTITNNIMHSVIFVDGGRVSNNLLLGQGCYDHRSSNPAYYACVRADHSYITNNIMTPQYHYDNSHHYVYEDYYCYMVSGSENTVTNNLTNKDDVGDNCTILNDVDWNDVFINYNNGAINPNSNFHLQDSYRQYENTYGVYSGTGFNDKQIAPVPYIVAKRIAEETDAAGQLKIQVRVKAGE